MCLAEPCPDSELRACACLLANPAGLVWWRRRRKRQLKKRALSDNPEAFGQKLSAALRERELGGAVEWAMLRMCLHVCMSPQQHRLPPNLPSPRLPVCCFPAVDAAWNQPSKSPADSPASPATRIASGEAGAEVNSGPNDTAMGRGAERSGGLSTATAAGSSGPIPELPFAAALLSPNDFSIETGRRQGRLEAAPVTMLAAAHWLQGAMCQCSMQTFVAPFWSLVGSQTLPRATQCFWAAATLPMCTEAATAWSLLRSRWFRCRRWQCLQSSAGVRLRKLTCVSRRLGSAALSRRPVHVLPLPHFR